MAEVFRAEVTWSGTSQTNGEPSIFYTAVTTGHFWTIEVRRSIVNARAEFYFFHNSSFISGTFFQFGADFSAYDSGGVLAIEKDEAADEVRWITPLGTETRTLSGFGALNSAPLRPSLLTLRFARSEPLTQDSQATVKWGEFFGRRDGSLFIGAHMSANDPGAWLPESVIPADATAIPRDNGQETSVYRMRFVYAAAIDNPKAAVTNETREWDGGDNIFYSPGLGVEAAVCPISGFLYTVRSPGLNPNTIVFGRSVDGGATIAEAIIHSAPDDKEQFGIPSLAVDAAGLIVATWVSTLLDSIFEVVAVRRSTRQSEDFGATWTAVLHASLVAGLSLVADVIRFHPYSGHLIELYQTDADLLDIVYDTYKPTVFTRAAPWATALVIRDWLMNIRPALAPTAAGEWLLTWLDGTRTLMRTENHGLTWTTPLAGFFTDTGQASLAYSPASGLHYLLQQDKLGGDLRTSVSDDEGVTVIAGLSEKLALAGAVQQFAALVVDHGGKLLLVYLSFVGPGYEPLVRKSEDHGITWSNA
jgi:hypothetical protein